MPGVVAAAVRPRRARCRTTPRLYGPAGSFIEPGLLGLCGKTAEELAATFKDGVATLELRHEGAVLRHDRRHARPHAHARQDVPVHARSGHAEAEGAARHPGVELRLADELRAEEADPRRGRPDGPHGVQLGSLARAEPAAEVHRVRRRAPRTRCASGPTPSSPTTSRASGPRRGGGAGSPRVGPEWVQGRVVMGLLFYPRGGSAYVVRYLSPALARAGWSVVARGRVARGRRARRPTPRRSSTASTCTSSTPPTRCARSRRAATRSPRPDRCTRRTRTAPASPTSCSPSVPPELADHLADVWEGPLRAAGADDADVFHLHHLTPQLDAAHAALAGRPAGRAPPRHRAEADRRDRAAGRARRRARRDARHHAGRTPATAASDAVHALDADAARAAAHAPAGRRGGTASSGPRT